MGQSINYVIWSSFGLIVLLHQLTTIQGASVSACFNSTVRDLQVNCGTGNMLRITKAFYGHNSNGACAFQPGDCTQAEYESYPCIGQDSCSISLPNGNFGQKIPSCEVYSNYFQVEYECEPVVETIDICSWRNEINLQRGFILTPGYPNNYANNLDCSTKISVHPSQKINLTIIDMDLEINGNYGCFDEMYAFNQYRSVTLCGKRSNEKLTSLQSNEISIRFQSNSTVTKKGFWMYYEAYPPLPSTSTSTTKSVTPIMVTRPRTQGVTTGSAETSVHTSTNKAPTVTKEKLPFVAIVAGVIGTLTFILIVLLVLLCVRWWNEKKQTAYKRNANDAEYLDARNPAFRSSTGTEFQGVEIYYNC